MTPVKINEALDWCLDQSGLEHWKVKLSYTDIKPLWADTEDIGTTIVNGTKREALIWVSPLHCKTNGSDPLQVLFHEIRHIALRAAGIIDDNELVEFDVDRTADMLVCGFKHRSSAASGKSLERIRA